MNLIKLLLEFNKISREIANNRQGGDLPKFLYEKLKKLVEMKTFSLGKIENDRIKYNFYIENNETFENVEKTIDKEKSLVYYATSNNKIIIINEFDKEISNYVKETSSTGENIRYNSILVHPFKVNGEMKGFFSVQDTEKNYFTQEKIILFKEVAQYIELIYERIENENKKIFSSETFIINGENKKNSIKEFTNSLVCDVKNIDDLVELFLSKLSENYSIKEMKLQIHKSFSNETLNFVYKGKVYKVKNIKKDNVKNIVLEINGNYMGNLYFYNEDSEKFDDKFSIFLELFILGLGNFIEKEELEYENYEKHQLVEALENADKNLKTINETVKDITSTMDLKELGRRVYRGLVQVFDSDCAVALAYYNDEKEELEYDILIDYGDEYDLGILKKDDTSTFAPWVVRNKKKIIVNDYEKEAKLYIDMDESQVGISITKSLIYLPLYKNEEIIGVFTVQKKEKDFFDNYHIELVKGITSFVNIALINLIETRQLSKEIEEKKRYEKKLEKINKKLEKISSMDSLTKLYNRRYFEKVLKEFWFRAEKEKKALGFIIFDLDYFKQINDTFGHLTGDKALIEMAGIIKKYVKTDVKFGRFGGDEFVGLVYNPDKNDLIKMGQEMKESLKGKKIKCPNTSDGILSLTMGITIYEPLAGKSMDELFLKADAALYKGKEQGRNQIVFFEEDETVCLK